MPVLDHAHSDPIETPRLRRISPPVLSLRRRSVRSMGADGSASCPKSHIPAAPHS